MRKKSDEIDKRYLRKDKPVDQWALLNPSDKKRPQRPKEKTSDITTKTNASKKETEAKRKLGFLPKKDLVHSPVKKSNIFSKGENNKETVTEEQEEKTSDISTSKITKNEEEQIIVKHKLLRTPPPKSDILSSKKETDDKDKYSENSEIKNTSPINNNRLLDDKDSISSGQIEKIEQLKSPSSEIGQKSFIDSNLLTTSQSSDKSSTLISSEKAEGFIDINKQTRKRPNLLYETVYSTTPDKENNEQNTFIEKSILSKQNKLKEIEANFDLVYKPFHTAQTSSPKKQSISQKTVQEIFFNKQHPTSTKEKPKTANVSDLQNDPLLNSSDSLSPIERSGFNSNKENEFFDHSNNFIKYQTENNEMALALTIEEATNLLPEYDGNEKHLESYISLVDQLWLAIALLNAQEKAKFLLFLRARLTKKAADVAVKINFNDWETAKTNLRNEINPPANIEKCEMKLCQVKQKEKESVEDYAKRVEDLLISLNKSYQANENIDIVKNENDRKARRSFENGLFNANLKYQAIGHGSKSFNDSVAYTVEQSLRLGLTTYDSPQRYEPQQFNTQQKSPQQYNRQQFNRQRKYCSFHNVNTHNTNECKAKRQNDQTNSFSNNIPYNRNNNAPQQYSFNQNQQKNVSNNAPSPASPPRSNVRLSRDDYFCVSCKKQGHTSHFCKTNSPVEGQPIINNNNGSFRQNQTNNSRAPRASANSSTIRNSNHVVIEDQYEINENLNLPNLTNNNALTLEEAMREYEPDLDYEQAMREYEDDETSKN